MNKGSYSFSNRFQRKVEPRKCVLVYSGPQSSGKTWQMKKLRDLRGIPADIVPWHTLKDTPQIYWKFLAKDPEGVEYLFIDEYNLLDTEANFLLHELSLTGIMIVVATQTEPTSLTDEIPSSFRITRCSFRREVVNG